MKIDGSELSFIELKFSMLKIIKVKSVLDSRLILGLSLSFQMLV